MSRAERGGADRLSELAGAAGGALGSVLDAMGEAIAGIADVLRRPPAEAEHPDTQVDAVCDQLAVAHLLRSPHVGWIVSEERTNAVQNPRSEELAYIVSLDPLDGSENHGVQVTTGMIMGVFGPFPRGTPSVEGALARPGGELVAAAYAVFGPAVVVGYTIGAGTHLAWLGPSAPAWHATATRIQAVPRLRYVSTNWGNLPFWPPWMRMLMDELVARNTPTRQWTSRHVGTLVADFHRNLLKGGVFLYPGDRRSPRGKLRLLYECCPLALLAEQSGLAATDGDRRILELGLVHLHERSPLVIGDPDVVRRAGDLLRACRESHEDRP